MPIKPLTKRDFETLRELAAANFSNNSIGYRDGWAKSLDFGGSNGSHHSVTLVKLTKRGLVEVMHPRTKQPWRSRYGGNKYYKITHAGRWALKKRKAA